MKLQGPAVKASVLIGALLACLAFSAPATSAKASKPPVFWIDLMGTARQHPDFVYFTANAGGQVHSIKWTGWGKNLATGRGIYHDSSPSYPGKPNREGPAKIITWKPVKCVPEFGNLKGKTIRVYSKALLRRKSGKGGQQWVNIDEYTGTPVCR